MVFRRAAAVVLAGAALGLAGAQPAVSDGQVADLVGTVAGPTSGQIGDVFTYTVTATNRGPDPADAQIWFSAELDTFELIVSEPACAVSTTVDQFTVVCRVDGIAAGATSHLRVQVRVKEATESAVDGIVTPVSTTDPDMANNAQSIVAFPAPPVSPQPPPPPPPPPWQSFSFASEPLPDATQYRSYTAALIAQSNTPLNVAVVAGAAPPGLMINGGGLVWGHPYTPGTYTFTIEVDDGVPSQTARHEFTLVVLPFDGPPPDATGTADPPASLVGATVLLAKQTRTSGCRQGALPDRRCSPGAYYSKLTKNVICATGFRSSTISYLPDSVKHAVETEYGLAARDYGSILEIDHIVSLNLGGSNDIANLFPERAKPAPGFRAKDRLENKLHALVCAGQMTLRTAQRSIATDWRALYKQVFGVSPAGRSV